MSVSKTRPTTPVIVLGSLFAALGLTALADTEAQAGSEPRSHAALSANQDVTELRVLDWTLWNVSKYYVEPQRVDPRRMTLAGLEALESQVAEVLVEPLDDQGKRVKVRVGTAEREFSADVDALWAVGPHLREVFRFVSENTHMNEEQQREAEYAIVEGVLASLDPHTNLLRPEAFDDMKTSTTGHFGGLGIEVGMRDGQLTIIRVLDGNPASKVGLQAGDRIVQIDEESTVTMTLNDAVSRMRGAAGTTIMVYVRREGLAQPKKFSITRDIIKLDSVIADILPGVDADGNPVKVGLVQIPRNFAQTTGRELRAKLEEFEKQKVHGVVLDMRDNPGGLLTAAVEVADAFLSAGTIVSTVGAASSRDENKADSRYDFPDLPLVVLVDQGSASATEIVAGALRNLDRAVIVGRRTFGKGSVQVLHDRRVADKELALKLTIAQYLTPGDISIQSVGVSPDLETVPVFIGKTHVAYHGRKRFDLVREESLASHLMHGTAKAQKITAGPLHFLQEGSVGTGTEEEQAARVESVEDGDKRAEILLRDAEIRVARDLVLWAPSSRRSDILAKLDDFSAEQATIEDARISKSLDKQGVDWSKAQAPTGQARLRVKMELDKKGNVIRGGEAGTLTVSITNEGDAPAYRLRGISDSDYSYFDERELMFGKVGPGETKKATLKLSVSEHELSRTDRISFDFAAQHPIKLAAGSTSAIDVSGEGLARPKFAYGYQVIDDPSAGKNIEGNGDGVLQMGERVRMRVWIENTGTGKALDSWVHLRNLVGDAVFLHEGRAKLGQVDVGKPALAELDFEVKKATSDGKIRLQLTVSDNKIGEYVTQKLVFPIYKEGAKLEQGSAGVGSQGAVDLYAAPRNDARVVARTAAGATFKSLGIISGWTKVDLGKKRFAYAKSAQLSEAKAPRKPGKHEDVYQVSPPAIELATTQQQTDGKTVHISGTAIDPHGLRDLYITVVNPSRDIFGRAEKVFYQAADRPKDGKLDFAADVPLTPGNNLIEITAREDEEVVGTKRMWVLRTSGLDEARMAEANYESRGGLAVDSFQGGSGK